MTTFDPSFTSNAAVARPIPPAPPVTIATLPASSPVSIPRYYGAEAFPVSLPGPGRQRSGLMSDGLSACRLVGPARREWRESRPHLRLPPPRQSREWALRLRRVLGVRLPPRKHNAGERTLHECQSMSGLEDSLMRCMNRGVGGVPAAGISPLDHEERTLSDRDDITSLVHRYATLLDSGRLSDVVALFSRATWRSARAGHSVVTLTNEEVKATYDRVILYADGTPRTHHLITNLTIDVAEGADDASGSCYFTVLQGIDPGQPIETILSGRYSDRFRRDDQGWYFVDRVFHTDLIGDQSRHFARS